MEERETHREGKDEINRSIDLPRRLCALPLSLLTSPDDEKRRKNFVPLAISAAALYFVTTSDCKREYVWRRMGMVDWGERVSGVL